MKFLVTVECDGQDCDGPINHGARTEVLTNSELMECIGRACFRHGGGGLVAVDENVLGDSRFERGYMVFSNQNDEGGFSRTAITYKEVAE